MMGVVVVLLGVGLYFLWCLRALLRIRVAQHEQLSSQMEHILQKLNEPKPERLLSTEAGRELLRAHLLARLNKERPHDAQ